MKFLSRLISFIIFCSFLGIITLIGVFYHYGKGLPNYQDLSNYEPPVISRIYANDGRLFGEFAHEQRVFLPIEAIPDLVKNAFIASEDQNFYKHFGVDPIAVTRSVVRNVSRIANNRRPIGGSTITQQVARNFLLTDTAHVVSIDRKIKEAILSLRIENAFTKDHIFELYLNDIYLGHRSYGVAAAAINYFNKSLNELTIAEAAFLAGLPKAPSRYNPRTNNKRAVERRNYVIKRMLEEGYIGQGQATQALVEPLEMKKRDKTESIAAPYFASEVRRFIVGKYGEHSLYEGGLTIKTTLDAKLQTLAHDVLREGLIKYDKRHGWRGAVTRISWDKESREDIPWLEPLLKVVRPAGIYNWKLAVIVNVTKTEAVIGLENAKTANLLLKNMKWARRYRSINLKGPGIVHPNDVVSIGDVIMVEEQIDKDSDQKVYHLCQIPKVSGALIAMDPYTGRVKAMQGGFNYNLSQYNRVTQALRQPGSSFKPFAYLAALEAGLTPSTIINDAPIAIHIGYGHGIWKPKNHDKKFLGPITIRRAFEGSRNAVTIRMIHEIVGMNKVVDVARRFGLHDNLPKQLSMLLGAGETTVIRQATAYSMIANGGKQVKPIVIDRIQNRKGKTIFSTDPRHCKGCEQDLWMNQPIPELIDPRPSVTTPEIAYQTTYLLHGVAKYGTSKVVPELKTRPYAGKTGTTNDFRDAWYAGFSPDLVVVVYIGYDEPRTLGNNEFGSKVAAPIFAEFMKRALKNKPPIPFRVPPNVKLVRVSHKTGARAVPGDKDVIVEAFRKDTKVPKNRVNMSVENLQNNGVVGTGQIY